VPSLKACNCQIGILIITNILKFSVGTVKTFYVRFELFHGGDYEEWRLLICYAMCLL
jgi:hypothetical protein